KALRASGVPIDLVGGTSMGAIVAAGVASRWTDEELVEGFRVAFVNANPLSDYTLPLISLYAGRRVSRLLRLAFGEKEIQDLILPFYCVTANLTTSNAEVHTVGRLWRWLRASVAIPGVIPPFNEAGEVHVDGGVINNFPVREMRRLGRGGTIGVEIDTGGAPGAGAGGMGTRGGRAYGTVVGLAVLPSPDMEAQRDPADPVDRAHPAALRPGRQHGARPRG